MHAGRRVPLIVVKQSMRSCKATTLTLGEVSPCVCEQELVAEDKRPELWHLAVSAGALDLAYPHGTFYDAVQLIPLKLLACPVQRLRLLC